MIVTYQQYEERQSVERSRELVESINCPNIMDGVEIVGIGEKLK